MLVSFPVQPQPLVHQIDGELFYCYPESPYWHYLIWFTVPVLIFSIAFILAAYRDAAASEIIAVFTSWRTYFSLLITCCVFAFLVQCSERHSTQLAREAIERASLPPPPPLYCCACGCKAIAQEYLSACCCPMDASLRPTLE